MSGVRKPLSSKINRPRTADVPPALCLFEKGIEMMKMKSYTQALGFFNQALIFCDNKTNVQTFLDIYDKRSSILYVIGKYVAAVEDCTFYLQLNPDDISMMARRMHSHEKIGNQYEANKGA